MTASALFAILGLGYKGVNNDVQPGAHGRTGAYYEKTVEHKKDYEQMGDECLHQIGFSKRIFGSEKNDGAVSIIKAADGGYLVGGMDSGKAWVIKLNKEG
jgi:hypothetical protein